MHFEWGLRGDGIADAVLSGALVHDAVPVDPDRFDPEQGTALEEKRRENGLKQVVPRKKKLNASIFTDRELKDIREVREKNKWRTWIFELPKDL